MDWALPVSKPKKQATVPSGILRIVLDDFSFGYNTPDLCSADHTIRPQHLTQCVRKEKKLLLALPLESGSESPPQLPCEYINGMQLIF